MTKQNAFKIYSKLTSPQPLIKANDEPQSSEDRLLLTGVASTTNRDLQDEIVSTEAIKMMAEQAPGLNIHGDHFYGLEDVIGAIKNVTVEDEQLIIDFLITKKYTPRVQDLLDTGIHLGLSIGGYVTDYDINDNIIKAIELREISLTAMPANWDTFGTVTTKSGVVESTCLSGACYNIIKNNMEKTNMTQEVVDSTKAEEQETPVTLEDVKDFLDEYMAEKEATMVEEVTNSVKTNVESLVESKVKELLDEQPKEEETGTEETESEPGSESSNSETKEEPLKEDEEDDEEEVKEESKSLTPEDIADTINKAITNALGDDFAGTVAAKMFDNLDQSRGTSGSKYEEFVKSIPQKEEPQDETTKSTYSTKETAKMLLNQRKTANPVLGAVMKNLE